MSRVGDDHLWIAIFAIGLEAGVQNTSLLDAGEQTAASFAENATFGTSGTYGPCG